MKHLSHPRGIVGRLVLGGASIAATVAMQGATVRTAHAQSDVTPPLPNVLILLDTSGSMERKPDATLPAVGAGALSTEKNRWIQALEVLGGSIQGYQMLGVSRKSNDFINEYGLGGTDPYDKDYYLLHYRAISNNCAIGAPSLSTTKSWPNDWNTWGVSDFGFRKLTGATLGGVGTCLPTDYKTDGLGLLDTFRDQARFALMTFDSATAKDTGWNGSTHNPLGGMNGQWSYYPGWATGTGSTPAYGWPLGCAIDPVSLSTHEFELGARNPSAPPWEGPLVPFAATDTSTALRAVNDRIRYAMMALRPYGATPIGPMLADAKEYLWNDPQGPTADPNNDCRGTFIILITDGFPNSDLRKACENSADPKAASVYPSCATTGSSGCCPSKRAQDTAWDLSHPPSGKRPVSTFVVGFAVSDDVGTPVDCSTIDPASGICSTMGDTDPKKPCCTLHEIAYNGGTNRAVFASDADTLRAALMKAMADATASVSTSRTLPVFTGAAYTTGGQSEFRSSFKVNAFGPWQGILERVRWACQNVSGVMTPVQQSIDSSLGDDFANNLNKQPSRRYITWNGQTASPITPSGDSLRPRLATADFDGVAIRTGTVISANDGSFVSSVPFAALGLTSTSCSDTTLPDECKQKYLNYALGLPQPKSTWLDRVGNELGDIYHATPVSVTPPSALIRDESYTSFRAANATRQPFMLVSTNDGLLHAFKSNVTTDSDPTFELWSFVPPAVLPHIGKQYGGAHALLNDAAPVVKDVAFGTGANPWGRTKANARGGIANWRTVMVSALSTGHGFYALDVTDPVNPQFLWQLTNTNAGAELFGEHPGQPSIGAVYYTDKDTAITAETPVAILPGGEATQFASGQCDRWNLPPVSADAFTQARNKVRCWTGPGLSFTVVRLYDGKILRSFRNDPLGKTASIPPRPAEPTSATAQFVAAGRTYIVQSASGAPYAGIDSPLTGAVALYPAGVGAVTTRAFIGDLDGGLWRADFSQSDPQQWTFSLFHDAYFPNDTANTDPTKWGPIATLPVVSVDRFGDVVVNYATGDQNNFSSTNLNHVYSLTERTTVTSGVRSYTTRVNWHLRLTNGVTPTGPLSLFNGVLYFSTFSPGVASAAACLNGQGTLWGVDYVEAEPGQYGVDGTPVPLARFLKADASDSTAAAKPCPEPSHAIYNNQDARVGYDSFFRCYPLDPGTIVFGAGITQRPSCVSTSSTALGTDPYFGGSSSHMTLSSINQGDFQIVAQTGPKGTAATGSKTNTFTRKLKPPQPTARLESWANVVE